MGKKEKQKIVRFDWAMKHLLRNKANFDILEGFMSALLGDNEIKVLQLIESEGNTDDKDEKFNRVDIMVQDGYKRKIIIEIQNTRESDYLERILFGTSKAITQSIDSGIAFRKIDKIISISILYFNLGIGEDYLYHGETIFKGLTTQKEIDKVKAVLPDEKRFRGLNIFPEYYLIQVEKYKNIINRAIDEWVYWFKNEEIAENSTSKNIDKVQEKLSYLKMKPEEKKAYQKYLERLASETDMIETAKNDGKQEAQQELLPKLKEAKAREEEAKAKEKEALKKLAKVMKSLGKTADEIMKETGLSPREIENL
ncbi:MAG: Rpn family recombination-promoting nuclease/putative transposase [Bacteroidales bacterium]|nr:Rpn family recombination-promoting nuclease/putative transposase [Bacteroidales bacterium]